MNKYIIYLLCFTAFISCDNKREEESFSLNNGLKDVTHIDGKPENGQYLYVTAGNMLYSIGNQAGDFPEIGFHVPGEMGGIWQHPIKLLDGFNLLINDAALKSNRFIAYPFANQFEYTSSDAKEVTVSRVDFVPDSLPVLVVEYLLCNHSADTKELDLTLDINSDLSPVWLGERSGWVDGRDSLFSAQNNIVVIKDSLNSWYTGITSNVENIKTSDPVDSKLKGKGINLKLHMPKQVLATNEKKTVRFYIAGSTKSPTEVEQSLTVAKENIESLFNEKKGRFEAIDKQAAITIPDTLLMKAYQWGKYNTDWLVRDVPGMGNGLSAGLPDYPWFFSNDQAATFSALVGTRDPQLFYNSWEMLLNISNQVNNNSGRIIHEVSTNGQVYDNGRMEESQGFINAAWTVFKWTGNKEFLKTYYEQGKNIWKFLQEHDKNNNLYVEGYGGVEIEGLNDETLDVAVSTQSFLNTMSQMAAVFGDTQLLGEYESKANILEKKINEDWWSPSEKRYFDFIADKDKAIQLIDMALSKRVIAGRNEWARKKLLALKDQIKSGQYNEKGYTVFYNASTGVLNGGVADKDKAIQFLESMPFFTNKYGLYISGIARPDDITLEEGSVAHRLKGEFNYHEAIMTIGTAGLAIAECKYRGSDYAMRYLEQILNNFSFATPGTTYEVCPDYGMFVQAWNVSGINIPLIHYMFGVDPTAYKHEISISPDMPSAWNFAKLERLMIVDNRLSIDFKRSENSLAYTIESTQADWIVYFKLPDSAKSAQVNGKPISVDSKIIRLTGLKNTVEFFQ